MPIIRDSSQEAISVRRALDAAKIRAIQLGGPTILDPPDEFIRTGLPVVPREQASLVNTELNPRTNLRQLTTGLSDIATRKDVFDFITGAPLQTGGKGRRRHKRGLKEFQRFLDSPLAPDSPSDTVTLPSGAVRLKTFAPGAAPSQTAAAGGRRVTDIKLARKNLKNFPTKGSTQAGSKRTRAGRARSKAKRSAAVQARIDQGEEPFLAKKSNRQLAINTLLAQLGTSLLPEAGPLNRATFDINQGVLLNRGLREDELARQAAAGSRVALLQQGAQQAGSRFAPIQEQRTVGGSNLGTLAQQSFAPRMETGMGTLSTLSNLPTGGRQATIADLISAPGGGTPQAPFSVSPPLEPLRLGRQNLRRTRIF